MSTDKTFTGLTHLLNLRGREKDKLQTEVAAKQMLEERFEQNIHKLEALCSGAKVAGGGAIHAMNATGYKAAMKQLSHEQQQDLALHRKDMQLTQAALVEAARKREAIDKILAQKKTALAKARVHSEQKMSDELAAMVWSRGRH
jgi:flagellar export protein FliJ